jgi:hypothetical protein
MNPGPVEEAGTTARSVVAALSSQPVVLALVVFNVLYLAGSIYLNIKEGDRYDKAGDRWKSLVETVMKNCVTPPQEGSKP